MRKICCWSLGTALVLLFVVAACGRAEKTPQPVTGVTNSSPGTAPSDTSIANPVGSMPVASTDRLFVAEAAASGLAEIEASRLVAARTSDAGIKAYTQQLEREHMSTHDELKRIAGDKGITVQNAVEGRLQAGLDKLRGLANPELEQAFLRDFGVDAHDKAIGLFENQARQGQDAELRAFAAQTLPKLREHLGMAQQLQNRKAGG